MPWYDSYEAFWPELTDAQKQRLEEARSRQERELEQLKRDEISHAPWTMEENRVPGGFKTWDGRTVFEAVVVAHIDVAVQQADAQLARLPEPMPEDQEATIRFPGVSPRGKYSAIDMKAAQRRAGVEAAMQLCTREREQAVRGVLDSAEFGQLWEKMRSVAMEHRRFSRAAKLCRHEQARELLAQQAGKCKTHAAVADVKRVLDGLEYLVGLRNTAPAPEDTQWLRRQLRFPEAAHLGPVRRGNAAPGRLEVRFENFEDRLVHQVFSAPQYWSASAQELGKTRLRLQEVYAGVKPYVTASVQKVLEPALAPLGENGPAAGELLHIDGEPAARKLAQLYPQGDATAAQVKEHTAAMVAAALYTGKRVELFLPMAGGKVAQTPARVEAVGYQPGEKSRDVVDAAWGRFCAHLGFFREPVAQRASMTPGSR